MQERDQKHRESSKLDLLSAQIASGDLTQALETLRDPNTAWLLNRWDVHKRRLVTDINNLLETAKLNCPQLPQLWQIIEFTIGLELPENCRVRVSKFIIRAAELAPTLTCSILTPAIESKTFTHVPGDRITKVISAAAAQSRVPEDIKRVVDLCIALIKSEQPVLKVVEFIRVLDDICRITCSLEGAKNKDIFFAKYGRSLDSTIRRQEHGARLCEAIALNLDPSRWPPEVKTRVAVSAQHLAATAAVVEIIGRNGQEKPKALKIVFDYLRIDPNQKLAHTPAQVALQFKDSAHTLLKQATNLALRCFKQTEDSRIVEKFDFTPNTLKVLTHAVNTTSCDLEPAIYDNLATILHCSLSIPRTNSELEIKSELVVKTIKALNNPSQQISARLAHLKTGLHRGLDKINDASYLRELEDQLVAIFDSGSITREAENTFLETTVLKIADRIEKLTK